MIGFFYIYLTAILIFEGFTITNGREIALYLLYSFPFIMILMMTIVKGRFKIPYFFSIIFSTFVLFSFVSTYFAADVSDGLQYTFVYMSVFLLFLITYNLKEELIKKMPIFIFSFSVITLLFACYLTFFMGDNWPDYVSNRTYQFVYPSFNNTQHPLGRWLIIPTIFACSMYFYSFNKKYLLGFICFALIVCLTFVRAAYVSLIVTTILILFVTNKRDHTFWQKYKLISIVFTTIIILLSILTFSTVKEAEQMPLLNNVHTLLKEHVSLPDKTLLGLRIEHYTNAIDIVKSNPFFGLGPNNLTHITEFAGKRIVANTRENMFLEVFAENGLIGGLLFTILIFLLIKSAIDQIKSGSAKVAPVIFVFIGLLIMFQIDSSVRFYSFLIMFFLLAGLFYKEEEWKIRTSYLLIPAVTIFIFFQLMIINSILTKQNKYEMAHKIYPFNKENYAILIQEKINNKSFEEAKSLLRQYKFLYKGNNDALKVIDHIDKQVNY